MKAPYRVAGFIERSYSKELDITHTVPGSRFYPIGGTFYRVGVRKRATIRIEVEDKEQRQSTIRVHGAAAPARADQRILLDVLLPDGKTRKSAQTKTNGTGQFDGPLSLLDDKKKLLPGPYRVQAFIFHASELADAESNVVYISR